MNTRRVGILVGTLALASASWAGQPARRGVAELVRLTLYVDHDSCYEREPVGFHVGVRNITDEPLKIGLALSPFDEQEYFIVHYRRLGGEWVKLTYPESWRREAPTGPRASYFDLAPGQEGRVAFSLAADPGRGMFVFDKPGDYEVRIAANAPWSAQGDLVASPIVRVHVEPAPDDERRPLAEFWDIRLATLAQNDGADPGMQTNEVLPRVLRFVEEYPHSLYARHALAGAARQVEYHVLHARATQVEKALYRQWKETQGSRP